MAEGGAAPIAQAPDGWLPLTPEQDWLQEAARDPNVGRLVDALGREGPAGSDALAYLRDCPRALALPVLNRVSRQKHVRVLSAYLRRALRNSGVAPMKLQ